MIIRPAELNDAHAIAAIHVRSWQHAYQEILPAEGLAKLSIEERTDYWREILKNDQSQFNVLLAEQNETIVGFASWALTDEENLPPNSAMLYSIYALPEFMGKGVGSELLESVDVEMIVAGADNAVLWVLEDNAASRRFYERHGWQLQPDSARESTFFDMTMRIVQYRKHLST